MDVVDSEYKRKIRIKFKRVVLILLVVALIAAPCFLYFSISTQAHLTFREAKNIKLATNMLAVEYYGEGRKIFDPSKPDGMAEGVRERLLEVTARRGDIRLLGYDNSAREVTAFTYESGHIKVTYTRARDEGKKNGSGKSDERWIIDYIFRYAVYESNGE